MRYFAIVAGALILNMSEPAPLLAQARAYLAIGEYYGTVYTKPSSQAEYVLLKGLQLSLKLSITNEGKSEESVIEEASEMADRVRITNLQNHSQTDSFLSATWGSPQPGSVKLTGAFGQVALAPRSSVRWFGLVMGSERLAPGIYRVKVGKTFRDSQNRPVLINNMEITFEVRDIGEVPEQVEYLRISAMRALAAGDVKAGESVIARLQKANPNSVFAQTMLADIALSRGDRIAAEFALQRALDLVRSRADSLFVANAREHSMEELAGTLYARLLELRR